ncbi:PREDICTED: uncharacterized protein LOC105108864 [Populus euphratica]|uniref:Uncharacterized protein LOC105108864 n=1 Tax=Populus euphratica TaxID=75702 RepID=A0AAJ6SZ21_POPEU|nr:PREDICTED: uncharacterized protein LOC105108864 [Populus euphratica]
MAEKRINLSPVWIKATLSDIVLSTIYGLTSRQLWTTWANRFAPPSPSRIFHLKRLFYTPRQPCQICGKTNHQALNCYNRMHFSYQGSHPPSQLAALRAQSNVHITDDLDHLSLQQQSYQGADTVTEVNDLGPLSFFLGIQVTRTTDGLHLHQVKYVTDLLHRTKMVGAKPLSTPCSFGGKLSKFSGGPLSDSTKYRSMVGALQYLTLTRPDIFYSVNQFCQFLHSPTTVHLTATKHILRYL